MTFDGRESSQYSGQPYELFLFQTGTQVWHLSSGDQPRTYGGQPFEPTAITHTEPDQGTELKSGSLKLQLPFDHEVALLFRAYAPDTPLWLTIFRAHEGEAESETVTYWIGKVTKATFTTVCELECAPEQHALQKTIPSSVFQSLCNRILFDAGCGVSREAFRIAATLTTVHSETVQASEFASKEDGWWKNGYLEFGLERRMVYDHTGDTLVLESGMAALEIGTQVYVYAGCEHTYDVCQAKFSNGVNFFGFQWVPTRNPFNGVG